jgi:hypothetical protein
MDSHFKSTPLQYPYQQRQANKIKAQKKTIHL